MTSINEKDLALAQLVTATVAVELGVNASHVFSKHKGPSHVSFARQLSMYLMSVAYGINASRVGRVFGRDRSTVSHACKLIEDCRDEENFDDQLEALEVFLKSAPTGMS